MSNEPNPIKYPYRWLRYTRFQEPSLEGGFLLIPVANAENATQIRSALIEGGFNLFPDNYEEIYVPAMLSNFNTCDMIANCLLENEDFLNAIAQQAVNRAPSGGSGDSRLIPDELERSTEQSDLNKVWGGCLEVFESVNDLGKIFCDILEAAGDAISAVSDLLSNPVGETVEWVADNPVGVQKNWSTTGSPKWDTSSGTQTYEKSILEPTKAISPSRLLSILQRGIDIGVAILRGALNEDFQEACAGILFNELTCLPDGTRKSSGIVLTTEILSQTADILIEDADLIKKFAGFLIKAEEIIGSIGFLSLLALPDLIRQYRIGFLQPSASWEVIVDPCGGWTQVWDFTAEDGTAEGWVLGAFGVYVAGVGYRGTTTSGVGWRVDISNPTDVPQHIQSTVTYTITNNVGTSNKIVWQALPLATVFENPVNGVDQVKTINVTGASTSHNFQSGSNGASSMITVTRIVIKGLGVNPYI